MARIRSAERLNIRLVFALAGVLEGSLLANTGRAASNFAVVGLGIPVEKVVASVAGNSVAPVVGNSAAAVAGNSAAGEAKNLAEDKHHQQYQH